MTYKEKIILIDNRIALVDKQVDALLEGDPVESISSDGSSIKYLKLQDLQDTRKQYVKEKNALKKRFSGNSSSFAKMVVVR